MGVFSDKYCSDYLRCLFSVEEIHFKYIWIKRERMVENVVSACIIFHFTTENFLMFLRDRCLSFQPSLVSFPNPLGPSQWRGSGGSGTDTYYSCVKLTQVITVWKRKYYRLTENIFPTQCANIEFSLYFVIHLDATKRLTVFIEIPIKN